MSHFLLFTTSFFVLTFSQPNEQPLPSPDEIAQLNSRFLTSSGRVPNFGFERGTPEVPGYYERMRNNPEGTEVPEPDFPDILPFYLRPDYLADVDICLIQYPIRDPNPNNICPAPGFADDWFCGQPWDICGSSCNNNFICICDLDVELNNVCWQDNYCFAVQDCNQNSDCGLNQVCVPDTCCNYPVQRTVCLDLCEDPNVPSPTLRPTSQTRNPTPETPAPVPAPVNNSNECPCDIENYWSCLAWTPPERCGIARNPQWGCYCVPQEDRPPWNGFNDPEDNSCVENNWCSAAPVCATDDDCPIDYECIPNTCCSGIRSRCVRCCEYPYNDPTPEPSLEPTQDIIISDCPCDNPSSCIGPFNWGGQNSICGHWYQTLPGPQGQPITWQDFCQCTEERFSRNDPNNVQEQVCLRGATEPFIGNILCGLSQTCSSTSDCLATYGPGYYCADACCSDGEPRCVPCCEYPFRV